MEPDHFGPDLPTPSNPIDFVMKNMRFHAYTGVDWLYFGILAATVAVGGATACSILREQEVLAAFLESDMLAAYGEWSLGLAPLAVCLLAWRIWLAGRYRPCPPLPDAALPLVTIVIPAYNEGRQVLDTVRSVMASDYPARKMQVVCVDDGSADDTWHWMTRAAGEFPDRVKLLRQKRNMGKRHALLAGFAEARGSVFVTIDSDSEVLPGTLRHLVSPLAASPRVGAVAGNVRVLNLEAGPIPKMLDVSFTMSFDFLRRGQSVFGGVLCTPGALSAYRASVLAPEMAAWAEQTFMGRPANIGEDRALSNIVLGRGFRVVYQAKAVVLTKIPDAYQGLCRMMLRWARSNVRECLVMAFFLPRRFRAADGGAGWIRLSGLLELAFLPLTEVLKVALLLRLFAHPLTSLRILAVGCAGAALVPAVIYQFRRKGLFGWKWAMAYTAFWMIGLSWISLWGLVSAGRSGWLTRGLAGKPARLPLASSRSPETA